MSRTWKVATTALILAATSCSSGHDDEGSETSGTAAATEIDTTTPVSTAMSSVPRETTLNTALASSTSPTVPFPTLEPAIAQQTLEALETPAVSTWFQTASAAADHVLADPCSADDTQMTAATVDEVLQIADQVLAELMINLDGALGGIRVACSTGNLAAAEAEAADVAAIVLAIQIRLQQLGREETP